MRIFSANKSLWIIIGIATLIIASDIYFISLDNKPQSWDPALHLTYSYIYFQLIKSLRFSDIIYVSNYYPPFFHLSAIPLYIFGFSEDVATYVNIFYYILLILSVYGIAREIWGEKEGIISAIIASFSPMLLTMQREFMLDFAFASLISATLYFFIKSKTFRDFKYSLLFGLFFGFAQLTKWNAPIFVLPFVASYIYFDFISGKYCPYCGVESNGFCSKEHRKAYSIVKSRVITNAIIAFFIAFLVSAWWYLPNLKTVLFRLSYFANIGGREGDPSFLTLEGWIYYLKALGMSMSLIYTIIFIIGFVYLLKIENNKHFYSFALVFLTGYVILTVLSNKNVRYILPIIPVASVISARFIRVMSSKISKPRMEPILLVVVIIIGLLNLSSTTFGYPKIGEPYIFGKSKVPVNEDWKIKDVLNTIASYSDGGDIVLALADHPYYNGQSLEFYRIIGGYNFRIYNGVYLPYQLVVNNFDKINFIIVIEPRKHKGIYGKLEKKLYDLFYSKKNEFKLIGNFKLPDNTNVYIYKRIKYYKIY